MRKKHANEKIYFLLLITIPGVGDKDNLISAYMVYKLADKYVYYRTSSKFEGCVVMFQVPFLKNEKN